LVTAKPSEIESGALVVTAKPSETESGKEGALVVSETVSMGWAATGSASTLAGHAGHVAQHPQHLPTLMSPPMSSMTLFKDGAALLAYVLAKMPDNESASSPYMGPTFMLPATFMSRLFMVVAPTGSAPSSIDTGGLGVRTFRSGAYVGCPQPAMSS